MTKNEEKEIVRVCGPNYEESDIPSYIRKRDEEEAWVLSLQEDEWREKNIIGEEPNPEDDPDESEI